MRGNAGAQSRISRTRERLEQWRQRYGGPGRRIPEELWAEVVEVARVEGVATAARELRIERRRLEYRVGLDAAVGDGERGGAHVTENASGGFVEVDAGRVWSSSQTVLRLSAADGEQLYIEVTGGSAAVDVVGLARAFWSRGR